MSSLAKDKHGNRAVGVLRVRAAMNGDPEPNRAARRAVAKAAKKALTQTGQRATQA